MNKPIHFLLILLVSLSAPLANVFAAQQNAPAQNGRFQIFFNPNVRADTFLVDTQTGTVWQLIQFTDLKGDPTVWNRMDIIDDDKQAFQFALKHGAKETENSTTPTR
jgi:hypothetical protein